MGGPYWFTDERYHDINLAMAEAVEPYLPRLYALAQREQKELDTARAEALLAKHA